MRSSLPMAVPSAMYRLPPPGGQGGDGLTLGQHARPPGRARVELYGGDLPRGGVHLAQTLPVGHVELLARERQAGWRAEGRRLAHAVQPPADGGVAQVAGQGGDLAAGQLHPPDGGVALVCQVEVLAVAGHCHDGPESGRGPLPVRGAPAAGRARQPGDLTPRRCRYAVQPAVRGQAIRPAPRAAEYHRGQSHQGHVLPCTLHPLTLLLLLNRS